MKIQEIYESYVTLTQAEMLTGFCKEYVEEAVLLGRLHILVETRGVQYVPLEEVIDLAHDELTLETAGLQSIRY